MDKTLYDKYKYRLHFSEEAIKPICHTPHVPFWMLAGKHQWKEKGNRCKKCVKMLERR